MPPTAPGWRRAAAPGTSCAATACTLGLAVLLVCASVAAGLPTAPRPNEASNEPETIAALQHAFETPPDSAAPMMRWWWFGPSVTHAELEREMRAMKAGGVGGVEIQPVYPLALDDEAHGIRTLPFLSDEFLEALRFVSATAQALGLRMDVTLGSGWPFGGPGVPIAAASAKLRIERTDIPPGARTAAVPDIGPGEPAQLREAVHALLKRLSPS